ncbi:hypothetical protein V8C42DRAFT_101205 [Trichoderma barbatum]
MPPHTLSGGQLRKKNPKSNIVKHKHLLERYSLNFIIFLFFFFFFFFFGSMVGVEDMGRMEGHRRLFLWIFTNLDIQGGSGWIQRTWLCLVYFFILAGSHFLFSFCSVDAAQGIPVVVAAGPQLFHHYYFSPVQLGRMAWRPPSALLRMGDMC